MRQSPCLGTNSSSFRFLPTQKRFVWAGIAIGTQGVDRLRVFMRYLLEGGIAATTKVETADSDKNCTAPSKRRARHTICPRTSLHAGVRRAEFIRPWRSLLRCVRISRKYATQATI